ncbi:hypothetical protein EV132_13343 [Rhizobium sullae]|uniref:Uncharacterized protein n=1 Tax=Rhizobium sullae TaxID=50338 RepID=A0A4R3PS39_RHISU|nr:hypothetical protein EV132_13343 [Rhizobium sullae]
MSTLLELEGFEYRTFCAQALGGRPLLLLHKTGGGESELVPLAPTVAPDMTVAGIRGQVGEDGKRRFFKRVGPGLFDEEDLRDRAAVSTISCVDLFLRTPCSRRSFLACRTERIS